MHLKKLYSGTLFLKNNSRIQKNKKMYLAKIPYYIENLKIYTTNEEKKFAAQKKQNKILFFLIFRQSTIKQK